MTELTRSLQTLLDSEQIRDVLFRYARGIDRLDAELFRTVFWGDGGFEDGVFDGPSRQFVPALMDAVAESFIATQHFISNVRIEFDGPDVAFAESYFLAVHRLQGDEAHMISMLGPRLSEAMGRANSRACQLSVGGRYLDRFEKRENAWRILTRRFVADWTTCLPESELVRDGLAAQWKLTGSRDRTDPSYRR